jgi:hypothetical protein
MRGMASIRVLFLLVAGLFSVFASCCGLMALAWGGTGWPNMAHILLWLLPLASFAAFILFWFVPKLSMLTSWLIFVGSYGFSFGVAWRNCAVGGCIATNPVQIALGIVAAPYIWILLIAAFCLQIAWQIEKVSGLNRRAQKLVAN